MDSIEFIINITSVFFVLVLYIIFLEYKRNRPQPQPCMVDQDVWKELLYHVQSIHHYVINQQETFN